MPRIVAASCSGARDDKRRRSGYRHAEGNHILTLKQLPDSRRAIVIALKNEGTATIAQLAAQLRLTGEAVRQQLLQLQREGWVEASLERDGTHGRTGRPATMYSLTSAGEHLFPKHYDALAISVIDAVGEELGNEAAVRVLERIANDRVTSLRPALDGLTLAQKVEQLKSWYEDDDPFMDAKRQGEDFLLIERNCPFYNTAMTRPMLCSVSVNALTRLLGVVVEREEKFQDGHGRCVFHAYAARPVDADRWTFRVE